MQTSLSVIVPVYNAEQYIGKCITSILSQTLEGLELILVDDGSTDKSGNICDEFAQKDGRVTVIHIKNGGPSNARNTAMQRAAGEYIGFVDADDWIEAGMYETLCHKADDTASDLVFCDYFAETSSGSVKLQSYYGNQETFSRDEIDKLFLPYFFGYTDDELKDYMMHCPFADFRSYNWLCVFRASVIKQHQIRFQSEKLYFNEDNLFNLDFMLHAGTVSHIPEQFYHYRLSSDSLSQTFNSRYFEMKLAKFDHLRSLITEYQLDEGFFKRLDNRLCVEIVSIINYYAGSRQLTFREKRRSVANIAQARQVVSALSGINMKKLRLSKVKIYLRLLKARAYRAIAVLSSIYSFLFKR